MFQQPEYGYPAWMCKRGSRSVLVPTEAHAISFWNDGFRFDLEDLDGEQPITPPSDPTPVIRSKGWPKGKPRKQP